MQSHYRVNQSPSTIPPRKKGIVQLFRLSNTSIQSRLERRTFEARPVKRFARNSIYPRHSGTRIYTHGSMKDSSVTQNARGSPKWTSAFRCGGTIKVDTRTPNRSMYPSRRSRGSKLTCVQDPADTHVPGRF